MNWLRDITPLTQMIYLKFKRRSNIKTLPLRKSDILQILFKRVRIQQQVEVLMVGITPIQVQTPHKRLLMGISKNIYQWLITTTMIFQSQMSRLTRIRFTTTPTLHQRQNKDTKKMLMTPKRWHYSSMLSLKIINLSWMKCL